MEEHITRIGVRDGRNGHRTEWDVICLCGWGVAFGCTKTKPKAWREANRWALHHKDRTWADPLGRERK